MVKTCSRNRLTRWELWKSPGGYAIVVTGPRHPVRRGRPFPRGLTQRKDPTMLQLLTDVLTGGLLDTVLGFIDIISWED